MGHAGKHEEADELKGFCPIMDVLSNAIHSKPIFRGFGGIFAKYRVTGCVDSWYMDNQRSQIGRLSSLAEN